MALARSLPTTSSSEPREALAAPWVATDPRGAGNNCGPCRGHFFAGMPKSPCFEGFALGCRVGGGDGIAVAACCRDGVRRPSDHPARIHYFGTWIGTATTTTATNGQRTTLRGRQRLTMTTRSGGGGGSRGYGGTIARGLGGGSARRPPGGRSAVGRRRRRPDSAFFGSTAEFG